MPGLNSSIFRFSDVEVHERELYIRRNGDVLPVEPKAFRVLLHLLRNPGRLVPKDELINAGWGNTAVTENSLTRNIALLRRLLGDDPRNPRYIETVSTVGYRFVSPLEVKEGATGTSNPEIAETTRVGSTDQRAELDIPQSTVDHEPALVDAGWRRRTIRGSLFVLAALFAILLGSLYLTHRNGKARPESEINQDVRVSPLTALPGYVGWPALSPDGKQVVFAWDGGRNAAKSAFDLYIKVIGAERIVQLTHQAAEAVIPAWSPDGSTIAFIRSNGPERGIFTMSVLGGPERRLDAFTDNLYGNMSSLSWSSDGRQLVYGVDGDLRLLTVGTGEIRTIGSPPQCKNAFVPNFSPDGKWIAFLCESTGGNDLYRASSKGESMKNVHRFVDLPQAIAWSGDGQRIVLADADNDGLLEIGANGGQPRRLSFAQTAVGEQIASRGNRLVYVQLRIM